MGRIYTATFGGVAVAATNAQDIFELVAPSDAIVKIHRITLGQTSDVGDAAEEILRLQLTSGHTTSGSGGASVTPVPKEPGDAAFGGTVERNNTTQAADGTIVEHYNWVWNVRGPFDHVFTPEEAPILSPSRRMCLELPAGPADEITMSGTIVFEEIGG
jgi:hypothetical protein